MKKLSDDDILKWLKSDEKANFIDKEKFMEKKVFPKPNQITRDTLRKILKCKIKRYYKCKIKINLRIPFSVLLPLLN